ncbi:Carrier domain-containing protein [Azospirillaceae bacterium]
MTPLPSMPATSMIEAITEELGRILRDKGETMPPIDADTAFLGGALPMDSLDLATLLVVLERRTGQDPFRAGFRQFVTVGELASLYCL